MHARMHVALLVSCNVNIRASQPQESEELRSDVAGLHTQTHTHTTTRYDTTRHTSVTLDLLHSAARRTPPAGRAPHTHTHTLDLLRQQARADSFMDTSGSSGGPLRRHLSTKRSAQAGECDCPAVDFRGGYYPFPRLFQEGHRAMWELRDCHGKHEVYMARKFGKGRAHTVYSDRGKTGVLKEFGEGHLTEAMSALVLHQEGLFAPLKLACKVTRERKVGRFFWASAYMCGR